MICDVPFAGGSSFDNGCFGSAGDLAVPHHLDLPQFRQFRHAPVLLLLFMDPETVAKQRDRSANGSENATCSEESSAFALFHSSKNRPKGQVHAFDHIL